MYRITPENYYVKIENLQFIMENWLCRTGVL